MIMLHPRYKHYSPSFLLPQQTCIVDISSDSQHLIANHRRIAGATCRQGWDTHAFIVGLGVGHPSTIGSHAA